MASLLAVDLGLKTGLALFGEDGRLRWYRSTNFGNRARLKRGVYGVLKDIPDLACLVLEGGGPLAEIWKREAERRQLKIYQIGAERWRKQLLYIRERRNGAEAKRKADDMARRVIAWSDISRPTALRHDTAEAILIGLWGVLEIGWLVAVPGVVKP